MTVTVVQFGGSNCDRDAVRALEYLGFEAERIWYDEGLPSETEGIILPGGFSYGDYLRAGAMAARSPIMDDVRAAADSGVPVLGICNGAQICAEAKLVSGAFTTNASARFQCEPVYLRVERADTPWTVAFDTGDVLEIPIAHGEGRFEIDDEVYDSVVENDRILFRYCEPDGTVTEEANVNGSRDNIAGLLGQRETIAVLMPHPERATLPGIANSSDGRSILQGFGQNGSGV